MSSNDPLVSVIIPVYNTSSYIAKTLDSVVHQTYSNLEVIVVDDFSSDGSAEVAEIFLNATSRRFKIVRQLFNKGVSAARNVGIKIASGTWIYFLDSDDCINRDHICKLVYGQKDLNCDFVYSIVREIEEYNVPDLSFCPNDNIGLGGVKKRNIPELLRSHGYVCGCLYSTEIIKNNGIMFHEEITYMEDCLFNAQYLKYVSTVSLVKSAIYYYVKRSDSASRKSKNDIIKKSCALIKAYEKNNFDEKLNINQVINVSDELLIRRYFINCLYGEIKANKWKISDNYIGIGRGTILQYALHSNLNIKQKIIEINMCNKYLEYLIYKIML